MERFRILFLAAITCLIGFETWAQIDIDYQLPPPEILELADAPMPPSIMISRDGKNIVLTQRNRFISIEELAETEIRLAGLRINPVTNTASRTTYSSSISIIRAGEKEVRPVQGLPSSARLASFSWSPDQQRMAFTNTVKNGVELWVLDLSW